MTGATRAEVMRRQAEVRTQRPGITSDGLVDLYTSHLHYADHLEAVWEQLGERRGVWHRKLAQVSPSRRLTLVASYGNLVAARHRRPRLAYMEHGCGFSYIGGGNPFAGGADRQGVEVFLDPNQRVRELNRAAHPEVPGYVIGTPKLDPWWARPMKPRADPPVVVFSTHWDYRRIPEARSAWPAFRDAIGQVARDRSQLGIEPVGHGHPRAQPLLRPYWRRFGMRMVVSFTSVLEQADLYVVDSSSTAYEFAATGRPVLLLDAPWYRRDVNHGLRFWEDIPGLRCGDPAQLGEAILEALADPRPVRAMRAEAVGRVYPVQDGSAGARAAQALIAHA